MMPNIEIVNYEHLLILTIASQRNSRRRYTLFLYVMQLASYFLKIITLSKFSKVLYKYQICFFWQTSSSECYNGNLEEVYQIKTLYCQQHRET